MDIKELIDSGARCMEEGTSNARMIDVICLTLTVLAVSYAAIFYLLIKEGRVLIPALLEAGLFMAIREINGKGYRTFAAFALIAVNNAAVFYFSAILGIMTEAHMLIFFFIGATLLFFKTREHRAISFGITLLTLVCCEINFYLELLPPLVRTHENQFIIRWLALPWVILLDTILLYLYIRSKELKLSDIKRLNSHTAHEIKTPINAMMLILNDLIKKEKREITAEHLNDLMSAAAQCRMNLENDLIDARAAAGHPLQTDNKSIDIRTVMDRALDLNEYIAKDYGVTLVRIWNDMPERIMSDENKVTKIVNNLVTNAVKFTPTGRTVTVQMRRAGQHWLIEVTDQGLGISKKNLDRIFKPYFTEGGATEGTGLGLSITNELVNALGGVLKVETSPNGCCFTASLPLMEAPEGSGSGQFGHSAVTEMPENDTTLLDQCAVLLVEDDTGTQKYLGKLLLRMGATVSIVSDVKMAIEQASRLGPDIILLDMNTCPELSGVDSILALASCYPGGWIVAVSGDKNVLKEVAVIGFTTLEKPLVPSELRRVLRSYAMENM